MVEGYGLLLVNAEVPVETLSDQVVSQAAGGMKCILHKWKYRRWNYPVEGLEKEVC